MGMGGGGGGCDWAVETGAAPPSKGSTVRLTVNPCLITPRNPRRRKKGVTAKAWTEMGLIRVYNGGKFKRYIYKNPTTPDPNCHFDIKVGFLAAEWTRNPPVLHDIRIPSHLNGNSEGFSLDATEFSSADFASKICV